MTAEETCKYHGTLLLLTAMTKKSEKDYLKACLRGRNLLREMFHDKPRAENGNANERYRWDGYRIEIPRKHRMAG